MSDRACYLYRTDRGGRLEAARLVSLESDDRWTSPESGEPAAAPSGAARWVRERLDATARKSRSTRELRLFVLDADGAACGWLSAPDADPAVVRAVLLGGHASDDGASAAPRLPDAAAETDYEPLAIRGNSGVASARRSTPRAAGVHPHRRVPVLAVPDAPARLMLDELDRLGVEVEGTVSIWHAMALAWDPAAQTGGGAESRSVADADAPLTAVTLVEPVQGRLLWCWSAGGALVACGSMRLRAPDAPRRGEQADAFEPAPPGLTTAEVGRLSAEWLSWSAQLGRAPSRVVCVGTLETTVDHALDTASFGRALAARWPGASIDAVDEPDGVALTLRRLLRERAPTAAGPAGPSQTALAGLSERPGRAHRAAIRWGALALVAGAAAVGVRAWALFGAAREARAQRAELRTAFNDSVNAVRPALLSPDPVLELETRASEARARLRPKTGFTPPKDVLSELDALSFVLGSPGVELTSLRIDTYGNVDLRLSADSTEEYESVRAALRGIAGSEIRWRDPSVTPRAGKLDVQFRGEF